MYIQPNMHSTHTCMDEIYTHANRQTPFQQWRQRCCRIWPWMIYLHVYMNNICLFVIVLLLLLTRPFKAKFDSNPAAMLTWCMSVCMCTNIFFGSFGPWMGVSIAAIMTFICLWITHIYESCMCIHMNDIHIYCSCGSRGAVEIGLEWALYIYTYMHDTDHLYGQISHWCVCVCVYIFWCVCMCIYILYHASCSVYIFCIMQISHSCVCVCVYIFFNIHIHAWYRCMIQNTYTHTHTYECEIWPCRVLYMYTHMHNIDHEECIYIYTNLQTHRRRI